MTLLDEFRHKTVQECQHQGSNMRSVDVGIRHDNDLVITKLRNIEILMNAGSECRDHCLDFSISVNSVKTGLLNIQDLAAKR